MVTTAALRAATPAHLQQVFARTTWREFNDPAGGTGVGFYPFIYAFDEADVVSGSSEGGLCVAHGSNAAFVNMTLDGILKSIPATAGVIDGAALGRSFAKAALTGGGYVSYTWVGGEDKVSLVVGIRRWGVSYYLGIGFSHKQRPSVQGPNCEQCNQGYNYPCSWENVLSLVAHVQTLLFMSSGPLAVDTETAFRKITHDADYGGDQSIVASGGSTSSVLYAFVFQYSTGLCVAHGVKASYVNTLTTSRHEIYMQKANAGGGWVTYSWRNSPNEPSYTKTAYVVKVEREGQEYYVGAGLTQQAYGEDLLTKHDCSFNWRHSCAERWAHRLAGQRLYASLIATSHADLMVRLTNSSENESAFGFASHVQSSSVVLADGHDPSAVGLSTVEWRARAGVTTSDLAVRSDGFAWLGPFNGYRTSPTAKAAPHFILSVPLLIEDRLTEKIGDGIGDEYTILVPVSAGNPRPPVKADGCAQPRSARERVSSSLFGSPPNPSLESVEIGVGCVGIDEYRSKCGGGLRGESRICNQPEWVGNGTRSWNGNGRNWCVAALYDDAPHKGGSLSGLQVWVDASRQVELCGCAADHELAFIPLESASHTCTSSASTTAVIEALHQPYYTSCAQSYTKEEFPVAVVVGSVLGVVAFFVLFFCYQRRMYGSRLRSLRSQVDALSSEMRNVRVVKVDYDPRSDISFHLRQSMIQKPMGITPPPSPPEDSGAGVGAAAQEDSASRKLVESLWSLAEKVPTISRIGSNRSDGSSSGIKVDADRQSPSKVVFSRPKVVAARDVELEDLESGAAFAEADVVHQRDLHQNAPNGAGMGANEHPEGLQLAARWFWQEQPQHMDKHHRRDIMQPGNFVAYAGMVCKELDLHFRAFLTGTGPRVVSIDLSDRIGSTGVEAKAYNAKTGSRFNVDFGSMVQLNEQTGFARKIMRKELPKASAVKKAERGVKKRAKDAGNTLTIPADIEGDLLVMYKDQLLQTSQVRDDGWAYGNVMYDPDASRQGLSKDNGVSNTSGWFNMARTDTPTANQMMPLAKQLGSGGGTMNLTPQHWTRAEESKEKMQLVPLPNGAEKEQVLMNVKRTQDIEKDIKVVKVERIENLPMWQTYVIKRQTMASRESEGKDGAASPRDQSERKLYHGTGKETVFKICQQGFNRSFAGTNVGMKYGQGCYFARDAAYSVNYSRNGAKEGDLMYLLQVRVAVGTFTAGTRDMIQPPPRNENRLFDSTVDKVVNPSIFVTYHDAQAYPEYLITFKEGK